MYLLTRSKSRSNRRTTVEGGRRSTSSCLSFRKPPSLSGSGSGSGRDSPCRIREQRIYGPTNLGFGDDEFAADQDVDRWIGKELLAKIERYYEGVKLVKFGHCFGLLDPVANILVGDAIALSEKSLHLTVELEKKEKKKKEKEKEKEMVEEEKERQEEVEQQEEEAWLGANQPLVSIGQRSLDGLVAFLVALFPYLTVPRAMWYLNKAELDPLVAARLIINHRGMERTFGFKSDTTVAAVELALRCAAAAAQHPNPRQFAIGWKLLSPNLRKVSTLLKPSSAAQDSSRRRKISSSFLCPESLPPALALDQSWDLASDRHRRLNLKQHPEMQVPLRPTLRRMLLTTIHGHYLQALAWLPKDMLCSHEYHHSLLQAGHSYGPLDPTSNIIANTLWYAQLYPLTLNKKLEIKAISTNALLRIAVRSLYGLISYLCTCYPALTPGEAMLRLQLAGANLQKAADGLTTSHRDGSGGVEEAYTAAAKAAHHPKPLQQAQFLGSSHSMLPAFSQVLMSQEPRKARTLLLEYLPTVVARSKPQEPTKNINMLGPWDYSYVMHTIKDFWYKHTRAVGMVECAIEMYSKQHGVPRYELHAICGVNEFVGGPLRSRTYSCSHINFLATKTTVGALPELFFAECRNKDGLELCCPVAMPLPGTEQVRCPYCELAGSRIVHPTKESFWGREREFEKMLFREGVARTATNIISGSRKKTYWVDFMKEDRIYGDYICDNNIDVEKFPRHQFY